MISQHPGLDGLHQNDCVGEDTVDVHAHCS